MTNTPAPTDDSHLFDDPAKLAREWERRAENLFEEIGARPDTPFGRQAKEALERGLDVARHNARHYRRMAERGERLPKF